MNFEAQHVVSITLGAMSLIGVCFTAWVARRIDKSTKETNHAVNHVGPGGLRLYEAVLSHGEVLIKVDNRIDKIETRLETLPCFLVKPPCDEEKS